MINKLIEAAAVKTDKEWAVFVVKCVVFVYGGIALFALVVLGLVAYAVFK